MKWIEERAESLIGGGHSRDTDVEYEVGFEADGRISALRARVIADVGAPTSLLGWTMSFVTAYCLPTVYDIPNLRVDLTSVVTNTCPWAPYRGFGKDVASFAMDRIIERVARETGLPSEAVRRRNLIAADAFPYERPGGAIIDSGDYQGVLDRLLAADRRAGLPRRAGGGARGRPAARARPRPGADARGRRHPGVVDELGL